jgi:hypothetical protein
MGASAETALTNRQPVLWWLRWVCVGVGIGFGVLQLLDLGTRYLVFATLGLFAAVATLAVPDKRRWLLAVFFFCLQFGATMFFFYRGGSRSVGWSGPAGIELPLGFLPAVVLFLMAMRSNWVGSARRWEWGGGVGGAGVVLCAASALSIIPSNEKFLTICSVLRAIELLVVFLAVANFVRDEGDIRLVLWLLPVVLLTQSGIYFVESAVGATFALSGDVIEQGGPIGRHGGTVGVAPSGFASFIHPLVQYALASFLVAGRRTLRWRACVLGIGILAMLLTYTRAAWAGMALGGVVVVALSLRRGFVNWGRVMSVAAVALMGLAVAYPKMSLRLGSYAADAEERMGLRSMAMAVIEAHPVLGVGAGTYGFEFGKYLPDDLRNNWLYVVHNAYLVRWAETGVLGFIGMIAFLGLAARDTYVLSRSKNKDIAVFGLAWLGGLVALAWEMYWDIWHGFPYNALLWALCGFAVALRRIDSHRGVGAQRA